MHLAGIAKVKLRRLSHFHKGRNGFHDARKVIGRRKRIVHLATSRTFVNRVDSDVLPLTVLLDGLALEVDGADGALAGLAQKRYRPVQYASHE